MTPKTVASVDLFGTSDLIQLRDPYAVYRRMRREAPVLPVGWMVGETWFVTRYDDVREAARPRIGSRWIPIKSIAQRWTCAQSSSGSPRMRANTLSG